MAISDRADYSHYGGSTEEARAHAYHYRGRVYQWRKNDPAKAVADYTKALQLDPKIEMVQYRRALAFHELKKFGKAHADFADALKRDPDYPNLMNAWAWQLATCPDPKFRDGELAVTLARKAKNLDTLAAAHAEAGDFESAIDAQVQAIDEFDAKPEPESQAGMNRREMTISQMRARLQSYRDGKPHRDEL